MSSSKKTSPWVWVGCGCAVIAVGLITVIAAVGMLGWRQVRELEATLKDPAARDAKVREILGTGELPAGLYGQFYLNVPFFMELAMLSDGEPKPIDDDFDPSDFGRNLITYLEIRDFGGRRARFRERLEAGRPATRALDDIDFDLGFESREVVERGSVRLDSFTYEYQLLDGEIDGRGADRPGLAVMGDLRCTEDDGRLRVVIWFRGDDDGPRDASGSGADLGTPRDAADVERLLALFDPC